MDATKLAEQAMQMAEQAKEMATEALRLANETAASALTTADPAVTDAVTGAASQGIPFLYLFAVFVLAVFVGYYVVWSVTPALHSPLMGVTNAISSVIIVGALLAAGPDGFGFSKIMGFLAVMLASVNIFGGFIVTQRMLSMFKKKERK
ncbi:NAD(P) transhydrogenase subunit alpha [Magnetospira sp. QH-2]|uniref:NAD(P) transhydrogenase subunit alpha n=1 Tax=Magnetospira sp. (strain QH-2) TaxID=1288970 RepID=UPI0003E8129E|nr:NAD(P) transhydrogenase subunit alpha [Magnetospira sp. QH-2]CCQ73498.1 NAD(P) transhydrogenase subunit alpha part 2 [Magnetospira sp. QH-2]